jgi:transcriptional regulator with AAA-type ATPase domain
MTSSVLLARAVSRNSLVSGLLMEPRTSKQTTRERRTNRMVASTPKRPDLGSWLADLRRIGGQARTLAERHAALESMMELEDLRALEETTKRLIVSLSKQTLYGFPVSREGEGTRHVGLLSPNGPRTPVGGLDGALTLPPGPAGPEHLAGTDAPGSLNRPHGIVGQTEAMRAVHHLTHKAAACSLPVLIQGESGTGKELVARAIHERSDRNQRRFFSENCSALSESLLESELFGHVRGAFTGADRDRKGIFELADGGTLFLDEIGDMSLRMQSKLLRALQEREVRPVGGKETIRVDVRIISATNRSLRALIKEGHFREDLFYRVNVITISLPPLRDRKDDIPGLVGHFLERIASETGLPIKEFTPGALELLATYEWPGNIRELENVVQRAVALSDGERIESEDLPERIRHLMITEEVPQYAAAGKGGEQLMIEKALYSFEGDKTRASSFIGWTPDELEKMPAWRAEEAISWGRTGWREAA